ASGADSSNMHRIEDLCLVSDDFSSLTMFYTLTPPEGSPVICWNSDTLKISGEGDDSAYFRFTHPYDVSVIPYATPASPASGGYWVADMGANQLVRMAADGSIAAVTARDAVIAPHAVSAARDGSCWAIDWGRESVVKVDIQGRVTARSTPCADAGNPEAAPCIIHPSALDCGGDPDTCFVADYEGNTVYRISLENDAFVLTRSHADFFRPSALEVVKTNTGDVLWVADHKSMAPTPVPGTWTPVILPPPTPTPPPRQRYTPVPPTPFPENYRISRNVFGRPESSQWPAAAPINLSPADRDHCWVADRDAGSYMDNEIRWLFPGGFMPVRGNAYHQVSMPLDVENVAPAPEPPAPGTPRPEHGESPQ
ncbi:MAG TPA: hypothetical protein PLV45_12570, partial [bacterium]|nr:hypothetical protein [bacterium]